jgi:hypothetical protein
VTTDTGVCSITHPGEDWNAFASATLREGNYPSPPVPGCLTWRIGSFGHNLRLKSCTPRDLHEALTAIATLRPREGFVDFELVQGELGT